MAKGMTNAEAKAHRKAMSPSEKQKSGETIKKIRTKLNTKEGEGPAKKQISKD